MLLAMQSQIPGPPERAGGPQTGPPLHAGAHWHPVRYLGAEVPPAAIDETTISGYHPASDYNRLVLLKGRYSDDKLDKPELTCKLRFPFVT